MEIQRKNTGEVYVRICEKKQILSEAQIDLENIGVRPMRNPPERSSLVTVYQVLLLINNIPEIILHSNRFQYQGGIIIHRTDNKNHALVKAKEILAFIAPQKENIEPQILEEMSFF